jgi:hypothetical protein
VTDEHPARRRTRHVPACASGEEPDPAPARGAHPGARCRAIEVLRDPHTHDPLVELDGRVRILHPRLLAMLAHIATRFPNRRIEVVSGYRPSRDPDAGSRHAHARALDFRVQGVRRETLRDEARTLPDAGVGYYPNSVFVHLDVRDHDEGSARWTDYAGPGERARYGHWPPREADVRREIVFVMHQAARDLQSADLDVPEDEAQEHTSLSGAGASANPARNEGASATVQSP